MSDKTKKELLEGYRKELDALEKKKRRALSSQQKSLLKSTFITPPRVKKQNEDYLAKEAMDAAKEKKKIREESKEIKDSNYKYDYLLKALKHNYRKLKKFDKKPDKKKK